MTVDFEFGKAPAYRVATLRAKGKWSPNICRPEFAALQAWAKKNGLRTGKWIVRESDDGKFEACLEIRGRAKATGGIRLRTFPASAVARVTFDPEAVSPRVVYHGLNDWLRWRKKDGEVKAVRSSREVYSGDPWTVASAWKNTTVEFLIRR
jgi:hypothetical protein